MADDKTPATGAAATAATPAPPANPAAPENVALVKSDGYQLASEWMNNNLAGGPLAQNTELWNAVHAALPALAKLIDGK